ncbi:MAG: hypothetical protein MUF54_06710, partial [Polyangiaceae bacterium]|nr:hypothetical protein [Polyangiaceae bacterium]
MTSGVLQNSLGASWTTGTGGAATNQEAHKAGWGLVRIANDGSLHPVPLRDGVIVGAAPERTPGTVHIDAE